MFMMPTPPTNSETEAPLAIRPYLAKMTLSELNACMVAGFATTAGGVLAAYVAMLGAAVPPPVVVLPPSEVMILAGPPPLILSPPAYALSVWPVLAFAPPMLAVAVLHDEWWSSRYRGRGGYYAGGFYASRGYAGGLHAASPVAMTGFAGPPMMQRRGLAGYAVPFGGHGHGGGHEGGHQGGGGHGHDH